MGAKNDTPTNANGRDIDLSNNLTGTYGALFPVFFPIGIEDKAKDVSLFDPPFWDIYLKSRLSSGIVNKFQPINDGNILPHVPGD